MARKNRTQLKTQARKVFVVKAGGPAASVITRSAPVISYLDDLLDSLRLEDEQVEKVTVSELQALQADEALVPGQYYQLADGDNAGLLVLFTRPDAAAGAGFDPNGNAGRYTVATAVFAPGGSPGGSITLSGITEFRDRFGANFEGGLQELAETLLIKPYPPSGSLYAENGGQRPYGGPTAVVLHWSVTPGTAEITQVTVAGQPQPAGKTSGTVTTSAALNTGGSFPLHVVDADGREFNALTYVTFGNKRYWGVSSQDPLTLSDAALSTLLRSLSQEFSESRQQEREFDCANQYIVYAWVATAGAGNFYLNGLANTAFQAKTFAFDNGETGDGHLQSFRVSRNGSLLSGHFSSKVS